MFNEPIKLALDPQVPKASKDFFIQLFSSEPSFLLIDVALY